MSGHDNNGQPKDAEKPYLVVTMGDPCGIGPEIILKALQDESAVSAARLLVAGDEKHLRRVAREHKLRWPFTAVVKDPPDGKRWEKPQLLDLDNVEESLLPGQISVNGGRAAIDYIERAVEIAASGRAAGIVTAPIHKEALALAGCSEPGHTEMLGRLTGRKKVGMLFWAEEFAVGLLTTHMSLRDALRKVRKTRIVERLKLFDAEWRRFFGAAPRFGVAAVNPHAGEAGRFGIEEIQEIQPALEKARELGLRVDGPVPADSVFSMARDGRFDVVLAMYHDQATVPIKLLCRNRSVNVSVGLPFVRTSVDHGTAMDIAGKGTASADSMVQAIVVGARLARSTAAAAE